MALSTIQKINIGVIAIGIVVLIVGIVLKSYDVNMAWSPIALGVVIAIIGGFMYALEKSN